MRLLVCDVVADFHYITNPSWRYFVINYIFGCWVAFSWMLLSFISVLQIDCDKIMLFFFYYQVFFSILIASFSFGQAGPSVTGIGAARGAAHFVFDLIERVSRSKHVLYCCYVTWSLRQLLFVLYHHNDYIHELLS